MENQKKYIYKKYPEFGKAISEKEKPREKKLLLKLKNFIRK